MFVSPATGTLGTVNKVDVMEASRGLNTGDGQRPPGNVTHAPYRREPYIRVQLDDGRTVDAKAAAWTRTHVLAHWDDGEKVWDVWVEARCVRRIPRGESAWQDPYDLL